MSDSLSPTPPGGARLRRSRRQFIQASALATLAALGLHSAANAADLPPAVGARQYGDPGDFVVATGVDITTLDPQLSTSTSNVRVTFNLFDTLVTGGPDLSLEPGLATSWNELDDRTWEFKLRPGVTFHNGDPLTARDVAFTIGRTLDPAEMTVVDTVFSTVERIETPDDLTVRFTTYHSDPLLPSRLASVGGQILPERYFKQVGADRFAEEPVGSGPIKFATWVPNDYAMFDANTAYWGGAPDFNRVIFKPMALPRDRVRALIEGKAQIVTRLSPEWRLRLTVRPEAHQVGVPYAGLYVLGVNTQNKPLDNPLIRQALSLAIDRDSILGCTSRSTRSSTPGSRTRCTSTRRTACSPISACERHSPARSTSTRLSRRSSSASSRAHGPSSARPLRRTTRRSRGRGSSIPRWRTRSWTRPA